LLTGKKFVFFLCVGGGGGWIKSEVYKRNVNTREELLADILGAAACINKLEDQLGQLERVCSQTQLCKLRCI